MPDTPSFSRRVATAAFICLLIASLFLLIGYAANFFFLVFGGIAFAVAISAPAHLICRKTPLSYGWAVGLVILTLVGVLGLTGWLLAPTVSEQADQLTQSLPQAIAELKGTLGQTQWGQRLLAGIPDNPGKLLASGGAGTGVLSQLQGRQPVCNAPFAVGRVIEALPRDGFKILRFTAG